MTVDGVRAAYNRSAHAWSSGPDPLYARLAEVLLTHSPVPVSGARVLDVGAGTGAACRAAIAAGAQVVIAADSAQGMLTGLGGRVVPVVADASALPFADDSFALVCAAFSLGHLPDVVVALRESRRVGRAVVASAFPAAWSHPAKVVVDEVLDGFGYTAPAWYLDLKIRGEPQVDDPQKLATAAATAGYGLVEATVTKVDCGLRTPAQLTRWRLGMAHVAPLMATLSADDRERARAAAERALRGAPGVVVPMVVLAAK